MGCGDKRKTGREGLTSSGVIVRAMTIVAQVHIRPCQGCCYVYCVGLSRCLSGANVRFHFSIVKVKL